MALVGYLLVHSIAIKEEERDARQWEIRLSLLAKAQAQNVSAWVRSRFATLDNLAGNMSLKLYMTELEMNQDNGATTDLSVEPAQQTYLRNLLIATSRSGGFYQAETPSPVRANIAKDISSGIALLTASGKLIVATSNMPDISSLPEKVRTPESTSARILSLPFRLNDQHTAIAFRVPVYGVQEDPSSAKPLGYAVGVAMQDASFFDLLTSLDQQDPTVESILLDIDTQRHQATYLSPLQNGTKPLALSIDTTHPTAEVMAALRAGSSIHYADYRKNDVLAVAALVEGTSWALARKIDVSIAMKETRSRAMWLMAAYALLIGLISAAMIALWRQATTLQARHAAAHFESLAYKLDKQEKLLDLIAENTPISTFIVDAEGHYRYANCMASQRANMQRDDMLGKTLEAVLGKSRATPLIAANKHALELQHTYSEYTRHEDEHGNLAEAIESQHIPLANIPTPESDATIQGVLVIEKDLTQSTKEAERRARTLNQLVETLVTIVDRRDPNAANHSAHVALISEAIAKEMRLPEINIRTAKTAGSLMNIGKILVPESLLTASDAGDNSQREQIRQALNASAELLENIEFDGPVVETLRQTQEHVDGSGEPHQLKGNNILITARIVGVANDFVAIISPRAWREGKSIDDALRIMLDGIDKEYDRSVVVALINFLDNGGGRDIFITPLSKQ